VARVDASQGEFRRGHTGERFELAAEVGRLFESKFRSHLFDRLSCEEQRLRGGNSLFIQPGLRGTMELPTKNPLELTR
jgi:hypothetical protein